MPTTALTKSSPSGRDPVNDRSGEEPQAEHEKVRPDEGQQGDIVRLFEHGLGDVDDPAIGAKLHKADHGVQKEKEKQESETSKVSDHRRPSTTPDFAGL